MTAQPVQSHTFTRSDLSIRPAIRADRAALEAIAAQIWEGEDYLPRVLDDWFSDPHGGFFVATLRDTVIGVGKVTQFAPGEWWLEGLRVDPAYQGYGFGRVLYHFLVNQVRQRGTGVVRFSTGSDNDIVQHMARETGFERVAAYLPYGADALKEPVSYLRPLATVAPARAWLEVSAQFARAQRSIEHRWSFYLLDEARLAERVAAGLAYGWFPRGDDLAGMVILNPVDVDRDPTLKIAYLDAPKAARDARRLAASLGCARVRIKLFDDPAYVTQLEDAGFVREWDGAVWLYARDIDLAAQASVLTDTLPPIERAR